MFRCWIEVRATQRKHIFHLFVLEQEYQLPLAGTRQQCSNVFILLFGKMKFKTLEVPDWFKTCNLYGKKDQDIIWSVLTYCHPSLTSGAQMWLPNKPGSQIRHQWCARGIEIPHGGKVIWTKSKRTAVFFSWVRPLNCNDYLSTCGA